MAKHPPLAYQELEEYSKRIANYGSILSLLHWDQEIYMPSGAIAPRSDQISQLSELIHQERTGRKFKSLLEKLVSLSTGTLKVKGLSFEQKAAIREWRKEYIRHKKLPKSFVKEFSQKTSEATQVWSTARKNNNFALFAPFLKKIVEMNRKKAKLFGFEDHPYDALLECYEPCMTTARIDKIFTALRKELIALLKKINTKKQIDDRFLHTAYDPKKQVELGQELMTLLPQDLAYTRLDLSTHPFSTGLHPHDSRVTTRLLPKGFLSNILSIMHEVGHSLYEMGLPVDTWGTPLSESISLSIHESQSRWWETRIGRSQAFWKFFYPTVQKAFASKLRRVPLDRFYRAIHKVSPTYIRVEADEVTYCLHVILRYEIEKGLITGDIQVDDLPEVWNAKMKEYLGITPQNDSQGCLQDIHWSLGDFGYFPTYALGNLFAAHFFKTFEKKYPEWNKAVQKGDMMFIREWLRENVHQWGRIYNADELAKKVTGKALNEKAFCSYLKKKYGAIYGF